jgi:oligoendopeptidase F
MATASTGLQSPDSSRWDLTLLFSGPDAALAELEAALERCRELRAGYAGRVARLEVDQLADLLAGLAEVRNRLARASAYAELRLALDVTGEAERDFAAKADSLVTDAEDELRFVLLEWMALPEARALELTEAPELAGDRHFLRVASSLARYALSEPEEAMAAVREAAAETAWQSLYNRLLATLEVAVGGESCTIDQVLAARRDPDPGRRADALAALHRAVEPQAATLAHCYDTLVADRLAVDEVRGYERPRQPSDVENELDASVVDTMLEAVERHAAIPRRWFVRKAELLGVAPLSQADEVAPVGRLPSMPYGAAVATVIDAFQRFSPELAGIMRRFVEQGRIDAAPRSGKVGGGFCAKVAQDAPPYVLLNYAGGVDDAASLAHELGHGVHFTLAAGRQTALSYDPPVAIAEIPAMLAELILLDCLLKAEDDPATKQGLAAQLLEKSLSSVYRQTVLTRFEEEAYQLRRAGHVLLAERLGDAWLAANHRYYGDTVDLDAGYRFGWALVPHFVHARFYNYAYVFAHLVSLLLYSRYRCSPDSLADPLLEFLALGGAASPHQQLAVLGIDIDDRSVWNASFAELERLVAGTGAQRQSAAVG